MSAKLSVPARVPVAVGVKVTLIRQLAPEASEAPQLLDWAKSPLAAMLVTLNVALPTLASARVCGALELPTSWLPKVRLEAEKMTAAPVPLATRLMISGLLGPLSTMLSIPLAGPKAAGVELTLMVQFVLAARELGQSLVSAKPATLVAMLEIPNADTPILFMVTAWAALVTPRGWLPKLKPDADKLTWPPRQAAVRPTTCGLPVALSSTLSVPTVVAP